MVIDLIKLKNSPAVTSIFQQVARDGITKNEIIKLLLDQGLINIHGEVTQRAKAGYPVRIGKQTFIMNGGI